MGSKTKCIIFCLFVILFVSPMTLAGQKTLDNSNAQSSKKPAAMIEKTSSEVAAEFLKKIKEQEKPLTGFEDNSKINTKADVTIYFFWASWCEYCEEGYQALVEMQERQVGKSVAYKAVNLDQTFSELVVTKAKRMSKFQQCSAPAIIMKPYPALQRLPIFFAEDSKTGRLVVSTGFSRERFYYFTKNVNRMLNGGVSDEE